jgi:hypothetical protein
VLSYPIAVIAVGYAFFAGRGRRWAWGAYGLLVLPVFLLWVMGVQELAICILIILGFVAVLGWYDLRRGGRDGPVSDYQSEP